MKCITVSLVINIISIIVEIIGLFFLYQQLKVNKEMNHMPILKLVECEKGFDNNEFVDYTLYSESNNTIDMCYTVYFKNIGNGLTRDIQIYSFNSGESRLKQLKTSSRLRIIGDVEVEKNCVNGINIRLASADIEDKNNIIFFIVYKNVYKDVYYGILTISDDEILKGMFFNKETNGFNAIIQNPLQESLIKVLKNKSKDKHNSNWIN